MAAGESVRSGWIDRWAGLGGVLYVVLFVVGSILSFGGQPDTDSPPEKLIAYYSDSGHRDKVVIGWCFVIVSVFFFLWFLGALRVRLRRYEGEGLLPVVATVGGAAYAACTLVAVSVNTGIKTMSDDTYRHQVYPELIHAADDTGYVIHSAGGAAIAVMMIAASVAALRARAVPVWLGWLGVVAGVIAIASIFFIPWFVIAAWMLAVSVMLVYRRPQGAQSAPR
jgi:hypothetical protein